MSLYSALEEITSPLPPIKFVILIYGAFGLTDSASRRLYGGAEDGLSHEEMAFYFNALLGDANPTQNGFDLLRRDLSGLPPCLVTFCVPDPLQDDSIALAALLDRAGVAHEIHQCDGVLHGYLHMTSMLKAAAETLQYCADFARRHAG